MLFYTVGQGSVFLWMICAGFGIGALYDLFRILRRVLQAGGLLSLLLDGLWGVLSGLLLAGMLVYANRGEMRLYVLLAAALGSGLYAAAVSVPLGRVLDRTRQFCRRIVIILSEIRLFKIIFR